MTMFLAPYTAIADIDGSPLDAGFIFFGEFGKNPESFPIPIYWDADFTIPAAQPIRTRNGYPIRNGSPCKIYLKQAEHSLVIKNKNLSAVLVEMNNKGISSSLLVRPNGDTVETSLTNIDAELNNKQQQIDEKPSQQYVDEKLDLKAPQETTYTKNEVDSVLSLKAPQETTYTKNEVDTAFAAYVGGRRGFTTLALAQAAQSTLPADTVVDVTNDPDPTKNGTYQWNGTTLTKSAYDPLTQAKADATTKANAAEANAKDYFKNNADVRFEANAQSNINYTTADRNLTFSGTVYAITSAGTKGLTTPQVLNLPSNTRYRIEYNISTNTLRAVAFNAARSDGWAVAGIVTVSATSLTTSDFAYFVDGAAPVDVPSEYGELTTDIATRINFSTIDKTLTITASRVLSAGFTHVQSTLVTIPFPTSSGLYSLVFNRSTRLFSFKTRTSVTAKNDIVLAKINFDSSFVPTITGLEEYAIDGVVQPTAGEEVPVGLPIGVLVATDKSEINFDFKNGSIIIAANRVRALTTVAAVGGLLPATTIDISGSMNVVQKLLYNTKTKAFRFLPLVNSISTDEVVVATFYGNNKYVSGVPYYLIDGEDPSAEKDDLSSANFLIPYGNLEAEYEQTDLPAFAQLQTTTQGDHVKVYDLYDALMDTDPDHITKTLLGTDGIGNNIYQYQFSTPEVRTVSDLRSKKPKIIAISGVHGYEPTGVYNLFYALKQIVESWKTDKRLEALYWGVNFIVVPMANPSGFDAITRENHNGVDIARNFPAKWSAAQPNSGGIPLSQAETVILDAVMSNNKDAIYCFSHHNFHTPSENFIWNASGSDFGVNLAKMLIIGQTIRAKNRYPLMMPQSNDYYVGYANRGTPPGSEGLQAQFYGIQGGTFEICNRWKWEAGTPPNSAIVATMGVETLINWLLLNVKYACELYNSRVNI